MSTTDPGPLPDDDQPTPETVPDADSPQETEPTEPHDDPPA